MEKDFERQVAEAYRKFDEWDRVYKDFLCINFGDDDLSEEKHVEISLQFQSILSDIVQLFIYFGKFRDDWDLPGKMNIYPFGQEAIIKSKKLNHEFSFGLYASEFFIETYVIYPWNLKHMPDDFWITFTELSKFGAFTFQDNAFPVFDNGKPLPEAFKYGRSNIYKIIRNCILLEQFSEGSLDLGWFKITWHRETQWNILIRKGCEAFKRIYKLNYLLYRDEYQRMRAK